MGQRRQPKPQSDDVSKRPNNQKNNQQQNTILARTQTRRGEVQRAARRVSENVNMTASQHVITVPVNKSVYNGYGGKQFMLNNEAKKKMQMATSGRAVRQCLR